MSQKAKFRIVPINTWYLMLNSLLPTIDRSYTQFGYINLTHHRQLQQTLNNFFRTTPYVILLTPLLFCLTSDHIKHDKRPETFKSWACRTSTSLFRRGSLCMSFCFSSCLWLMEKCPERNFLQSITYLRRRIPTAVTSALCSQEVFLTVQTKSRTL